MTLDNTKLKVAGSNLMSLAMLVYRTNDTLVQVLDTGYFNSQAFRLPVGTLILVRADEDGTPVTAMLSVTVNTGSAVTVANEFKGGVAI